MEAIITAINKLTETKEPEVDKLLKEMEAMGVDYSIGMDTSEVYSLSMSEEAFERAVRL